MYPQSTVHFQEKVAKRFLVWGYSSAPFTGFQTPTKGNKNSQNKKIKKENQKPYH